MKVEVVLGLLMLVNSIGCEKPLTRLHSVKGRLTVAGKPAAGVQIALVSTMEGQEVKGPIVAREGLVAVGRTDNNGEVIFTTYPIGMGVTAGEKRVTILWEDPSNPVDDCEDSHLATHDRLGGRYLRASSSPIRCVIRGNLDLELNFDSEGPSSEWQLRQSDETTGH